MRAVIASARARRAGVALVSFTAAVASVSLAFAQSIPGEPPPGDSREIRSVSTEEALSFAYDWAQFGKEPDTDKLIDTTIGVITVAYPPAGIVLGVAKGMITALAGGSDPVGEAIGRINQQLVALNTRMDGLQKQVDALKDFTFREANNARLRELKRRQEAIEQISDDLKARPTDSAAKAKLVRDALRIADRFLDQGGDEADLWDWSDRLHVYSDPANPGKLRGALLPPRFKPLPTFEYYMSALALVTIAIEYQSDGDPGARAAVTKSYGPALLRHASFLSVRPYWRELDEVASPEHLPERLMSGIRCGTSPVSKYPSGGECTFRSYCDDTFAQKLDDTVGAGVYTLHAPDPNTICSLPMASPRGHSSNEVATAREAGNLVYGSDALATIEDRGTRTVAEEEEIENAWGVDAMTYLADQLVRMARVGTIREQYLGTFDNTTWDKEFVYAVKPNGDLVWFAHLIGVDHNPSPRDVAERLPSGAPYRAGATAASGGTADWRQRAHTSPATDQVAVPSSATARVLAVSPAAAVAATAAPVQAPVIHRWEGPKLVGTGWNTFSEVIPAWYGPTSGSGAYGFSLYGVTPDGVLRWYRHDGFADGSMAWHGPVTVGTGWNSFERIIAMGDGVLYGIGHDGVLHWYRHNDVADAALPPQWSASQVVGSGWNGFVQVFGGGQGVIYVVEPNGTLRWYRHTGYLTGAATWEGPKVVGSGWQSFQRVFSAGEGVIYGLKSTGELSWYRHDGYLDGTPRWQPSAEVASGWDAFSDVFALLWGAPAAPIVR